MKLLKSLSWVFFANAFSSLTKWLMVILIAKNLSAVAVGIYSLAFAIGAPITLFANMKLRSLYITGTEKNIEDYFYSRNTLSVISFILLILIAKIFYPQYFFIIVLVGISKILDLQSEMYYAIPHKHNALNIVGQLIIIKQLILIIQFSTILIITESLTISLFIQVVLQFLMLNFYEKRVILKKYKVVKKKRNLVNVKKVLLLGLPLGFVQMVFSMNSNLPRFLLEYFESAEVLGYFSAIVYIVTVFNLFMASVSQVFLPKLSNLYNLKNTKLFNKYLYIYLSSLTFLLSLILISICLLFGGNILSILYGNEYADYKNILVWVSVSIGINLLSWNFDTALMATRYISIQPKITLINLFITSVTGYFFISIAGIQGAAYTMVLSSITLLLMRFYFVKKKLSLIN